jgi:hypothetical protein
MRYDIEDLEQLKFFLVDEQERASKCEDKFLKQLLERRIIMWQRLITEIEAEPKEGIKNEISSSS